MPENQGKSAKKTPRAPRPQDVMGTWWNALTPEAKNAMIQGSGALRIVPGYAGATDYGANPDVVVGSEEPPETGLHEYLHVLQSAGYGGGAARGRNQGVNSMVNDVNGLVPAWQQVTNQKYNVTPQTVSNEVNQNVERGDLHGAIQAGSSRLLQLLASYVNGAIQGMPGEKLITANEVLPTMGERGAYGLTGTTMPMFRNIFTQQEFDRAQRQRGAEHRSDTVPSYAPPGMTSGAPWSQTFPNTWGGRSSGSNGGFRLLIDDLLKIQRGQRKDQNQPGQ